MVYWRGLLSHLEPQDAVMYLGKKLFSLPISSTAAMMSAAKVQQLRKGVS